MCLAPRGNKRCAGHVRVRVCGGGADPAAGTRLSFAAGREGVPAHDMGSPETV